ncbi:MAG: hypothetical protein PW792_11265 [Acidobacteriaceae bacterium]|nr:hypothetical protein [Acidobacteriaceae bacterium]
MARTKIACCGLSALAVVLGSFAAEAQSCTTQSKMLGGARDSLAQVALSIASSVKTGDAAAVSAASVSELQGNSAAAYLVRTTADAISGDSLRVTQLYELDANARTPGDSSSADFTCELAGASSTTSFSISGLSRGLYAFAMVEAAGERPYVLSMLLRQDAGKWKLAGLYPHARMAAGHDGLWYWADARARVKAAKPNVSWLGWLEYGLADRLLRPANFVTSTHLEGLRDERSAALPPEVHGGVSTDSPYILRAADNTSYTVTELSANGSDDGKGLVLTLRYRAETLPDPMAGRARNVAAVKALMAAHADLRTVFESVAVFADPSGDGAPPFATQVLKSEW